MSPVYQPGGWFKLAPSTMLSIPDTIVSLTGGTLEIAIAVALIRRHLWRTEFPFFFAYICYSIVNVAVLLTSAALTSNRTYFAIYSAAQALYTIFGLLAMNESFRKIFLIYYLHKSWFSFLVPAVVLTVLLLSLWNWARHAPTQAGPLTIIYISLDLTANYMRAGIFGLFGILVFFWRSKWQDPPFGIIAGFGIFSVIGMASDALRSDFGMKMGFVFSYASAVAYILACVVWLYAFRRRKYDADSQPPSNVDPKELLDLLERPTKMLKRARNVKRCQ
jgi:hypothetical protein